MHRAARPEGLDLVPPRLHRSQSMTTDRPSISRGSSLASPPASVKPDPEYIAAAAASQIITSAHESQVHDWFEEGASESNIETALVSQASLSLVNAFLDQLLYNFLASARSTSLASLRPAVSEVLKPRLAKEAIAGADEELEEFLGVGDDEELSAFHNGQEPTGPWDLELVWKRTRLRCMVYTRLGDMEEEDEEMYIQQENLEDTGNSQRRLSRDVGIVSPPVAIFLTSILEFIGEHSLMVAGEAAYSRIQPTKRSGSNRSTSSESTGVERVVVEQTDMEKIAFNSTLGRLWRCWRKRVRSPNASMSLSNGSLFRKASFRSLGNHVSRKSSVDTSDGWSHAAGRFLKPSVAEVLSEDEPASIPLPVTENDIEEIEVPGFLPWMAAHLGEFGRGEDGSRRPQSMMISPPAHLVPPNLTPDLSSMAMRDLAFEAGAPRRRRRSLSLPTPEQAPFVLPREESLVERKLATPGGGPSIAQHAAESGFGGGEATPLANSQGYDLGFPLTRPSTSDSGWSEDKNSYQSEEEPQILNFKRVSMGVNRTPAEVIQAVPRSASSLYSHGLVESLPVATIEEKRSDGTASRESSGLQREDSKATIRKRFVPTARPMNDHIPRERQFIDGPEKSKQGPHTFLDEESDDGKPNASESGESRHTRDISGTSTLSGNDFHANGREPTSTQHSQTAGGEHGVPNLTPLRELMDAAPDASDEASSPATSYETLKSDGNELGTPKEYIVGSVARRSPALSHAKTPSEASRAKLTDLRKQLPAVYTGTGTANGTERAAVQRVSHNPVTAREPVSPLVRRSNSSGDRRPTHTSGSGTSQVSQKLKGLIGRQHGDNDKESIPLRTSSEESGSSDKHSQTVTKVDEKQRSFEQLMQSDETIQYTLTPQSMREMEAPESPRWTPHKRSEPSESVGLVRAMAPVTADATTSRSDVSNKGVNSPKSNSASDTKGHVSTSNTVSRSEAAIQPVSASSKGTSIRSGQPLARDARVDKDNTLDFADFIRSTGPGSKRGIGTTAKLWSRPIATSGLNTTANSSPRSMSASQPASPKRVPRKLSKSSTSLDSTATPKRAEPAPSAKPALKPREAVVPFGDQSADLIDFIRQGPPLDRSDRTHRIPRTVAPFRTTMDSDEIRDLGHGRTKDTATLISLASAHDSSTQSKSVHSSLNSRTGLLEASSISGPRSYASSSTVRQPPRSDEPPHPMRTQRRVRDPYAIDSDSDEDYDSRTSGQEEESLVDFLRNVPAPVIEGSFGGQTAVQSTPPNGFSNSGPQTPGIRIVSPPNINSASGESDSRKPPIQLRVNTSSPLSQNPTYATQVERERHGLDRSNMRTARGLVARSELDSASGGSQDLAEFLRSSEPPMMRKAYTPTVTKEETGFAKMFSRRKKNTGMA